MGSLGGDKVKLVNITMNRNWRKCFFVVQRRVESLPRSRRVRYLHLNQRAPSSLFPLLYLHFSISSPRPSDLIFILTTEDPRGNSPSFVVIPPARPPPPSRDGGRGEGEGGTRETKEGRPLSNSEEGDFSRASDCDQARRRRRSRGHKCQSP